MRKTFAKLLLNEMKKNENIFFLTGDLGFRVWDDILAGFPQRAINVGSSEQLMTAMAVGLSLEGKIPVIYSITPFLLYRPFEIIRTYIDHERIPVKMVGSGRGKDYQNEGYTHHAEDDRKIMGCLENIKQYHPNNIADIEPLFQEFIYSNKPAYINLRK